MVVALLEAYRAWISPLLGRHCRYEPTCSAYAIEAVRRGGVMRGGVLAVRRVARCHPFAPGGLDPVPDAANRQVRRRSPRNVEADRRVGT